MSQPRYCDQCGRSLVPLSTPHVSRKCDDCGKTVHLAEPGEEGHGIKVEKGDTFVIPDGWLTISLDPERSRGYLARPGVSWFVQTLMFDRIPRTIEDLNTQLDAWEKEADRILRASADLDDLDLDDEDDAAIALERLQRGEPGLDWWAFAVGTFVTGAKEAMSKRHDRDAALWAYRAALAWAMLVYHRDLEKHVWTGYQQNSAIHDIARAAAQTPAEAAAIEAVIPAFERLSEPVLHAWVNAETEIGPRLGVSSVDETLLKALAKYQLTVFDRKRAEEQAKHENRSRTLTVVIAASSAGAAVATAVFGALKVLGVI